MPLPSPTVHPVGPAPLPIRPAWREPLAVGAAALAGTAVLAVVNPNTTHVPLCPLKAATGLDCPFCGSLRAVHSLTRLDLAGAFDHNLLFTASVPFLVAGWVLWIRRAVRYPHLPRRTHDRLDLALLAVALVFGIVRNLPAFAWLGSSA